ncbi:uncharacterized protein LOC124330256 [Daphnia pulicaria]|uniref:uncharacterized protein LOC124330256 n=1 Tax=Daphnia pulicaria TaxID=35523 RepID=UPI001EEA9195|nr:uncharacterized protein LOC124330256 [Daphnia pulicaria]
MNFYTVQFFARNKFLFFTWILISLYLVQITMVYLQSNANGKNKLQFPTIRPNDLASSRVPQRNSMAEPMLKYNLMEEIYGEKYKNSKTHYSSVECNEDYANKNKLQQDHPCVIHLIQTSYLRKPTPLNLSYNLSKPEFTNPSDGQSQAILRLLRNQTGGFFIESGALDGEFLSNTLFMERFLNWTGILIEADRKAFRQLSARNRKAYTSPACLSTKPYPIQVIFNASGWSGSFIVSEENMSTKQNLPNMNSNIKERANNEVIYAVQCFPLYSILLAIGQTTVDFFGLDVEGSEYKILKTIPWHKVDIKTLSVEWNHIPEGELAMTQFMERNKYVKFGNIEMPYSREIVYIQDFLDDFRQYEFD